VAFLTFELEGTSGSSDVDVLLSGVGTQGIDDCNGAGVVTTGIGVDEWIRLRNRRKKFIGFMLVAVDC